MAKKKRVVDGRRVRDSRARYLGKLAAQIAETDEDAVLELVDQARSAIAAHDLASQVVEVARQLPPDAIEPVLERMRGRVRAWRMVDKMERIRLLEPETADVLSGGIDRIIAALDAGRADDVEAIQLQIDRDLEQRLLARAEGTAQ
jgi:hypothetical protein